MGALPWANADAELPPLPLPFLLKSFWSRVGAMMLPPPLQLRPWRSGGRQLSAQPGATAAAAGPSRRRRRHGRSALRERGLRLRNCWAPGPRAAGHMTEPARRRHCLAR